MSLSWLLEHHSDSVSIVNWLILDYRSGCRNLFGPWHQTTNMTPTGATATVCNTPRQEQVSENDSEIVQHTSMVLLRDNIHFHWHSTKLFRLVWHYELDWWGNINKKHNDHSHEWALENHHAAWCSSFKQRFCINIMTRNVHELGQWTISVESNTLILLREHLDIRYVPLIFASASG